MALPNQPVTLTVEQIAALSKKLSVMRHSINNDAMTLAVAIEALRRKPESVERVLGLLTNQPTKISDAVKEFSADFEAAIGITRP